MKHVYLLALSLFFTSCIVVPPTPTTPSGSPSVSQQKANVAWSAQAPHLVVTVNGQTRTIIDALRHEHYDEAQEGPESESVPNNAINGFSIPAPDGEETVYYAVREGNTVAIYSRGYYPIPGEGETEWTTPELKSRISL